MRRREGSATPSAIVRLPRHCSCERTSRKVSPQTGNPNVLAPWTLNCTAPSAGDNGPCHDQQQRGGRRYRPALNLRSFATLRASTSTAAEALRAGDAQRPCAALLVRRCYGAAKWFYKSTMLCRDLQASSLECIPALCRSRCHRNVPPPDTWQAIRRRWNFPFNSHCWVSFPILAPRSTEGIGLEAGIAPLRPCRFCSAAGVRALLRRNESHLCTLLSSGCCRHRDKP